MASDYDIIFDRRRPELAEKDEVWHLIHNSYHGGTDYQNEGYLYQHAKESPASFTKRKARAVYFNQIQPLADLLAGFLFIQPPSRKRIDKLLYLEKEADSKKKSINEFMKIIAVHSVLFTCGVLVDSPDFNPENIKTAKDRKDADLNPYSTMYLPFQIRDFNISRTGELEWVLLDNSYLDNTNPLAESVERVVYRLWTKTTYQDFEQLNEETGESIKVGEVFAHPIGYVPFKFVNWKDDNNDMIAESVFEDPAMISKLIYNKLSEMDEMIASGSFRVLMYPTKDGKLPANLVAGGIGALSAIPYDGTFSKAPSFDGAKLEDVSPFLKAIEFYISEILKKIGLDTDETKDYVKSGLAKKIDFQKVRTLLVSGSMALEDLERWIFKTAGMWDKTESKVEIHYTTHYADEDIQTKVDLLSQLLILPFKKLNTAVTGLIVKNLLTGELPQAELEEIYTEIESGNEPSVIDVELLIAMEQAKQAEAAQKAVLEKEQNKTIEDESTSKDEGE